MRISGRQTLAVSAALALTFAAGTAFADTKAGYDLWMAAKYPEAVAQWRPLADRGDADAQFDLGQAYKLGRGVPQDLRTAQSWFEKAAQQGHLQAQTMLGLILFQNGERERAMPWLRKGADAGDPRAEYVLGTALFNGDIVGKDWVRAYAYMTRAAAQGLPPAASNLQAMDQYVPVEQRRQGLALARQLEASAGKAPPVLASARPTPPRPNSAVTSTLPAPAPGRPAPARAVAQRPAPAPAPSAAPGGWRVQLGAFSGGANARRAWDSLRAKGGFGGLQPILAQAGAVTRLQAGPLPNRAAADRVCAAAKAAGSACFPVAP